MFRHQKVVAVFEDFDLEVAKQLDSLEVATCGYLSPVTDPFQPVNNKYHLTEKIIKVFVDRNLPVEFITKGKISDEAIAMIRDQEHSFGQVSILTPHEDLRRKLVPMGAHTKILFQNLERLSRAGKHAVCRIDPIFPYLTDSETDLEDIVKRAAESGAKHIVASCVDIPSKISSSFYSALGAIDGDLVARYRELYVERIDGDLNASIEYRRRLFSLLKEICGRYDVTFGLCMEYEKTPKGVRGLNQDFMTSRNCEGIDIPVYVREGKGKQFEPGVCDQRGVCLKCQHASCGIEELAMGRPESRKDWDLAAYRRWRGRTDESGQIPLF